MNIDPSNPAIQSAEEPVNPLLLKQLIARQNQYEATRSEPHYAVNVGGPFNATVPNYLGALSHLAGNLSAFQRERDIEGMSKRLNDQQMAERQQAAKDLEKLSYTPIQGEQGSNIPNGIDMSTPQGKQEVLKLFSNKLLSPDPQVQELGKAVVPHLFSSFFKSPGLAIGPDGKVINVPEYGGVNYLKDANGNLKKDENGNLILAPASNLSQIREEDRQDKVKTARDEVTARKEAELEFQQKQPGWSLDQIALAAARSQKLDELSRGLDLKPNERNELIAAMDKADRLKRIANSFQDSYASPETRSLFQNLKDAGLTSLSQHRGTSLVPEKYRAGAQWWSDWEKEINLQEVKEQSGASFTASEQARWDAAAIKKLDTPKTIREKLAIQQDILHKHLENFRSAYSNYNTHLLDKKLGEQIDRDLSQFAPDAQSILGRRDKSPSTALPGIPELNSTPTPTPTPTPTASENPKWMNTFEERVDSKTGEKVKILVPPTEKDADLIPKGIKYILPGSTKFWVNK